MLRCFKLKHEIKFNHFLQEILSFSCLNKVATNFFFFKTKRRWDSCYFLKALPVSNVISFFGGLYSPGPLRVWARTSILYITNIVKFCITALRFLVKMLVWLSNPPLTFDTFTSYSVMMPFCSALGTGSQLTFILENVVDTALTFSGAASGSKHTKIMSNVRFNPTCPLNRS